MESDTMDEAIQKMNEDLSNFSTWLKVNKLKLNVEKTKCMLIGTKSTNHQEIVKIENGIIEEVELYKYLGVIIDNKLSFSANADNVAKKMAKKIGFFFFIKRLLLLTLTTARHCYL